MPSIRDWEAKFQREQLHAAAQDGDLALVEKLLAAGYPVNRFDDLGRTPLHHAVREGHLDVVNRLLEAGADVNAHDERVAGDTPLSDSIRECSFEMVQRLVAAGANPTIPGWMQLSALDRVRECTDSEAKRIWPALAGHCGSKGRVIHVGDTPRAIGIAERAGVGGVVRSGRGMHIGEMRALAGRHGPYGKWACGNRPRPQIRASSAAVPASFSLATRAPATRGAPARAPSN